MSAVAAPKRTRITVELFQRMVESGVFVDAGRIELIEGELLDMVPIDPRHIDAVNRLNRALVLAAGSSAIVAPAGAVVLGDASEPRPDLMLLRPRAQGYRHAVPGAADVLLVVEVSDTSLPFDRTRKLGLYARFGIPEYWIVDVNAERILMFRDPQGDSYASERAVGPGESVSALALPNAAIAWEEIFG